MEPFTLLLGLIVTIPAVWFATHYWESRKQSALRRDFEAKYRFAQGENTKLKEQIEGLKLEIGAFQKKLEDEKASKNILARGLAASFKRNLFIFSAAFLCFGLAAGGGAGWMITAQKLETKFQRERADLEASRTALFMENKMSRKRIRVLEKTAQDFRKELEEARIQRVIAITKLEILLDSLSPKRGAEGFELDFSKFKNRLAKESDDSPSLRTPFFKTPQTA